MDESHDPTSDIQQAKEPREQNTQHQEEVAKMSKLREDLDRLRTQMEMDTPDLQERLYELQEESGEMRKGERSDSWLITKRF